MHTYISKIILTLLFCSVFVTNLLASDVQKFDYYPVHEIYHGPNHPLAFYEDDSAYWTSIRQNASKRSVNFAGNYIVYTGSCGGGAICGEIIDARTGEVVTSLPNAYLIDDDECHSGFYMDYRVDSNLIVIYGISADLEEGISDDIISSKNRIRYYVFNGNEFTLIEMNKACND